ncbi:MAG TPA: hypothetical protein VGC57_09815 [Cellulomonas sp.]
MTMGEVPRQRSDQAGRLSAAELAQACRVDPETVTGLEAAGLLLRPPAAAGAASARRFDEADKAWLTAVVALLATGIRRETLVATVAMVRATSSPVPFLDAVERHRLDVLSRIAREVEHLAALDDVVRRCRDGADEGACDGRRSSSDGPGGLDGPAGSGVPGAGASRSASDGRTGARRRPRLRVVD